jgi:hypothetical protein
MSDLSSLIKTFVDLLMKPKLLFGILCLGGLILFLPKDISDRLGFTPAIDPYRGSIGLVTLAAFVLWLRLAYCLDRNRQFIWLDINDPAAVSLRQKGLLVLGFVGMLPGSTHRVPKLALMQLQKNKSKLFKESFWNDPQVRRVFDQFDRNEKDPLAGPDF